MKIFNALKKYTKYFAASLAVILSVAAITPTTPIPKPGNPPECSVCSDEDDPPFYKDTISNE